MQLLSHGTFLSRWSLWSRTAVKPPTAGLYGRASPGRWHQPLPSLPASLPQRQESLYTNYFLLLFLGKILTLKSCVILVHLILRQLKVVTSEKKVPRATGMSLPWRGRKWCRILSNLGRLPQFRSALTSTAPKSSCAVIIWYVNTQGREEQGDLPVNLVFPETCAPHSGLVGHRCFQWPPDPPAGDRKHPKSHPEEIRL